jgi:hypothetical protein
MNSGVSTEIDSYTVAGTNVVFNIFTGAVGSTTPILTSNGTSGVSAGGYTTGFSTNPGAGDWETLQIVSVSGSVTQLTVTFLIV